MKLKDYITDLLDWIAYVVVILIALALAGCFIAILVSVWKISIPIMLLVWAIGRCADRDLL